MRHLPLLLALILPHHLVVNGDLWSVVEVRKVHDNPGLVGWTDCKLRMIELKQGLPARETAETLVHEAMHALACDNSGEPDNEKWNNEDDGSRRDLLGCS